MIDFSGRHFFIAGGSRGIGASAARMAAAAGARISINYLRDSAAADAVVADITTAGGKAASFQADISVDGEADRVIDAAVEQLGPLNGLVVSAGVFEGMPIEKMTAEFWDRTMSINVRGTFLATRAAVRHLRAAGNGGSIVFYSSTAGQRGSEVFSAYASSKGAQIMFSRSMARELGPDKIRVNCIAPSWTETDMAAESLDALGRDAVVRGFPLGRIGLPADVAGATCYLLSDLASFVTGITLTVDGGMDMRG